jgi:hypothetical protein
MNATEIKIAVGEEFQIVANLPLSCENTVNWIKK